jgi:hypothetical protein
MTIQEIAKLNTAIRPFDCELPEIQHVDEAKHNYAVRRDFTYFERWPSRKYAIRMAFTEYDRWNPRISNLPIPHLYLFITKASDCQHTVMPFYRGKPFWRERSFHGWQYADLHSNASLFAVFTHAREIGGMLPEARAQYEAYANSVYQHFLQQQVSE